MLIDSHCHLDYLNAPAVSLGIEGAIARARAVGVGAVVVPAVGPENFERVIALSRQYPEVVYALGIHPIYVEGLSDSALEALHNALDRNRHDPKLVAVGEIGLDHYVPNLNREKMDRFYVAQCKMANEFDLPVILHVRKAQDQVVKTLRRFGITKGIAHAFNGSHAQAQAFMRQGLKLGFGGAMTFTRALQIRRLAVELPLGAIVLETDSPDIAPAWKEKGQANEPCELDGISQTLAELRNACVSDIISATHDNALSALPRLAQATPQAFSPART
jgi:TatD DNase family protein